MYRVIQNSIHKLLREIESIKTKQNHTRIIENHNLMNWRIKIQTDIKKNKHIEKGIKDKRYRNSKLIIGGKYFI